MEMPWSPMSLLLAVGLLACTTPGEDRLVRLTLTTGAPLIAAGPATSIRVAILVDPATCLSCDEDLNRWMNALRAGVSNVSLAFDRPPTQSERKLLTLARIPAAVVLSAPSGLPLPRIVIAEPGGAIRSIALAKSGDFLKRVGAASSPDSASRVR